MSSSKKCSIWWLETDSWSQWAWFCERKLVLEAKSLYTYHNTLSSEGAPFFPMKMSNWRSTSKIYSLSNLFNTRYAECIKVMQCQWKDEARGSLPRYMSKKTSVYTSLSTTRDTRKVCVLCKECIINFKTET